MDHQWRERDADYAHCPECGLTWRTTGRGVPSGDDEYAKCPATPDFRVGTPAVVKAWWANGAPTAARIQSISPDRSHITVAPTEGNPHYRLIRLDALLSPKVIP